MTQKELHDAARKQPFEPFRIILTTGAAYEVKHPDLIMVGRRSAVIGITNDGNGTAYDRTLKVDLLHIVGIQELPPQPSAGNGTA